MLIVSLNCADGLRRCLEALERSTERPSMEILVVDNGSRDGTTHVPDDYAVTALRLPKNFGRTKALNIGIRTAKGDFVFLLDPHVEVQQDTVAPRLMARIAPDDAVGAVCPYVESAHALPSPSVLKVAWRSGRLPDAHTIDPHAEEVTVDYPKGAPMLVRRGFLKGMNYFDERLGEQWADLELCWQLRSAGKRILVLPPVRVNTSAQAKPVVPDVIETADSAAGAAAYIEALWLRHRAWLPFVGTVARAQHV